MGISEFADSNTYCVHADTQPCSPAERRQSEPLLDTNHFSRHFNGGRLLPQLSNPGLRPLIQSRGPSDESILESWPATVARYHIMALTSFPYKRLLQGRSILSAILKWNMPFSDWEISGKPSPGSGNYSLLVYA